MKEFPIPFNVYLGQLLHLNRRPHHFSLTQKLRRIFSLCVNILIFFNFSHTKKSYPSLDTTSSTRYVLIYLIISVEKNSKRNYFCFLSPVPLLLVSLKANPRRHLFYILFLISYKGHQWPLYFSVIIILSPSAASDTGTTWLPGPLTFLVFFLSHWSLLLGLLTSPPHLLTYKYFIPFSA